MLTLLVAVLAWQLPKAANNDSPQVDSPTLPWTVQETAQREFVPANATAGTGSIDLNSSGRGPARCRPSHVDPGRTIAFGCIDADGLGWDPCFEVHAIEGGVTCVATPWAYEHRDSDGGIGTAVAFVETPGKLKPTPRRSNWQRPWAVVLQNNFRCMSKAQSLEEDPAGATYVCFRGPYTRPWLKHQNLTGWIVGLPDRRKATWTANFLRFGHPEDGAIPTPIRVAWR
jgi:hypothetical protein